jgi:hypothetical protein
MPATALQLSFYLLCATAFGGLILSMFVLGARRTPSALSVAHGAAAVVAIVLFAVSLRSNAGALGITGLVFLLAAAVAGVYLAHHHPRERSPEFVVLWHAMAAVTGLIVAGVLLSRSLN